MIIPFFLLLLILTINLGSLKLFLLLLNIFGFFITGFVDDFLSIKKKENTGLKTKEKFFLQSVISIIFILLAYEKNLIYYKISGMKAQLITLKKVILQQWVGFL